eukprot:TRINITY_DN7633_c0_g1_i1.p1 TRINITY_DN7633_c0_g1~~TRINITY_DN7633_c0_g1_i1.p1  ORF type:complete len:477 (+),score=46.78 TRINITY_DN7633_c0_g1_i1:127-1431(+)
MQTLLSSDRVSPAGDILDRLLMMVQTYQDDYFPVDSVVRILHSFLEVSRKLYTLGQQPQLPPEIWSLILRKKYTNFLNLCTLTWNSTPTNPPLKYFDEESAVELMLFISEQADWNMKLSHYLDFSLKFTMSEYRILLFLKNQSLNIYKHYCESLLRLSIKYYPKYVSAMIEVGTPILYSGYDIPFLQLAIQYRPSVVNILVEAGCNINQHSANKKFPLITAVYYNRPSIVRYLVDLGCNINKKNRANVTALICACIREPSVVPILIEAGADVNVQTTCGETALSSAIRYNPQVIPLLLESGCDIYLSNFINRNPLMTACVYDASVVPMLLDVGYNDYDSLNQKSRNFKTAMMLACEYQPDAVPHLLNLDVNLDIRNKEGYDAFEIALVHNPSVSLKIWTRKTMTRKLLWKVILAIALVLYIYLYGFDIYGSMLI